MQFTGPITIHTLTVAGNLNVIDSLTVSAGDLTITGHLRICRDVSDFKMGNPAKTIISQSGANPTWGANLLLVVS